MINDDWSFPLDEVYIAFGDGSSNRAGTFYGLVLLPAHATRPLEDEIASIKRRFGGSDASKIHCRELFSSDARRKSCWSHLAHDDIVMLCGDVLEKTRNHQPKHLLGFIPRQNYPRTFRLRGKNGHADLVHDVDEKWLMLWAFFRVGSLLDPAVPIPPDDPKVTPRPRNRPFWNFVAKRADPGLKVKAVHLDREETKIRWFSKSLQWISVARELVIENKAGASYLPIATASERKSPLIDVADLFTYSLAREFVGDRSIDYKKFCGEALVMVMPDLGNEIVVGD